MAALNRSVKRFTKELAESNRELAVAKSELSRMGSRLANAEKQHSDIVKHYAYAMKMWTAWKKEALSFVTRAKVKEVEHE